MEGRRTEVPSTRPLCGLCSPAPVTLWLNVAYLVNALMCLYGFQGDRDPGWWLTLAGSSALAARCVLIVVQAAQQPASFHKVSAA